MAIKPIHTIIWSLAGIAGLILLWNFPPTEYMYIPCMFHLATGLHCPGCGTTRAVSSILHGDLLSALKNNVMIFLWAPYLAYRGVIAIIEYRKKIKINLWNSGPIFITFMIVITVLYTVLRNLPNPLLQNLFAPIG